MDLDDIVVQNPQTMFPQIPYNQLVPLATIVTLLILLMSNWSTKTRKYGLTFFSISAMLGVQSIFGQEWTWLAYAAYIGVNLTVSVANQTGMAYTWLVAFALFFLMVGSINYVDQNYEEVEELSLILQFYVVWTSVQEFLMCRKTLQFFALILTLWSMFFIIHIISIESSLSNIWIFFLIASAMKVIDKMI